MSLRIIQINRFNDKIQYTYVSTVNGRRMDGPWLYSRERREIFLFSKKRRPVLGPTNRISGYRGLLRCGIKQSGCEPHHSLLPRLRRGGSLPLRAFIEETRGKFRWRTLRKQGHTSLQLLTNNCTYINCT